MHIRHNPATAAAFLLGGMAVLHVLLGGSGATSLLRPSPEYVLPSPGSHAGKTLEWCRANVSIIHDVHWASACSVVAEEQRKRRTEGAEPPDDSPECTLPDDRALVLNRARERAEQQCLDEATAMAQR